MFAKSEFTGFLRQDGRKGIRNTILVVYLVECAHHVAREVVYPLSQKGSSSDRVQRLLSQPVCIRHDVAAL